MVSHPYARGAADPGRPSALSPRRRAAGWVLAVLGPVALTLLLSASRHVPTSQALAFLALTVLVALVGGLWPSVAAAVLGSLLLNYFFTPPLHTLTVDDVDNVVALVLFLVVAVAVATVVDTAARRSVQADLARREADALTRLNRALLRTEHGVGDLLDLVRETFTMSAATVLRADADGTWTVVRRPRRGPAHRARRTRTRRRTPPPGSSSCCAVARSRRTTCACSPPSPPTSPSCSTGPSSPSRRPRPSGWRSATGCVRRSWPPSRTTCAPRSRGSRRPSRRCARPRSPGPRATATTCSRPSRSPPTGSARSSRTCWT